LEAHDGAQLSAFRLVLWPRFQRFSVSAFQLLPLSSRSPVARDLASFQRFSVSVFGAASFLAILPARLYNLGVPDSLAQISPPRQRRHRRRRLRRFFQILAAGLLFSALLYLAIHLITKTRSSSDPDVPEDSTVEFK
jgi:hypothetical protein